MHGTGGVLRPAWQATAFSAQPVAVAAVALPAPAGRPRIWPGGRPPQHRTARQWLPLGLLLVLLPVLLSRAVATRQGGSAAPPAAASTAQQRAASAYAALPLSFEANVDQSAGSVGYLAHLRGATLFLTADGATLVSHTGLTKQAKARHSGHTAALIDQPAAPANAGAAAEPLRLQLVGAAAQAQATGLDQLPGTVNYFIGNDPSRWRTDVGTFGRVRYGEVYPGIAIDYYGSGGGLEYDFVLAPGADPSAIAMAFPGSEGLSVDEQGNLLVQTASGTVVQHAPRLYQEVAGQRRPVTGSYVLQEDGQIGFAVGAYDASRTLVIDPTLVYSTYLGGTTGFDGADGIAVDAAGNAYITGNVQSTDFPTTTGAFQTTSPGPEDAYVAKLNPSGTALVYSTYIGGSGNDSGDAIAVDSTGNAYITGETDSTDFPTTVGAFQTVPGGGRDAFVTKLNPAGSMLLYSTYLGGSNNEDGSGIAVDGAGLIYVAGTTFSNNFPVSLGAFQTALQGSSDAYVVKLNPTGLGTADRIYATYLGGPAGPVGSGDDEGNSIAVDSLGNAYIGGTTESPNFPASPGAFQMTGVVTVNGGNGFVAKLSPTGSRIYATYLGGGGGNGDAVTGIAVDGAGNAYLTGKTESPAFPTTPGAFRTTKPGSPASEDLFVTKLNPTGSALVYSTFLGGSRTEENSRIAIDGMGNAYITGATDSLDFPTVSPIQSTNNGPPSMGGSQDDGDPFISVLNTAGSALLFSTFLGGTSSDEGSGIAVDGAGFIYITGDTLSTNFPTQNPLQATNRAGAGNGNAFVAKISPVTAPTGAPLTVLKTASPNPATFGQPLTFTVTVQNSGAAPVTAAQLSDPLPAGVAFQSVTTSQGSCSQAGGTVTCSLGTLTPGSTVTVTITVTPLVTGTLTNTATVSGGAAPASGTVMTQVNPPGVGGAEPPVTGIPPLTIIGVPEVLNPNFPVVVTPPQQTAPGGQPAQRTTPLITVYPPGNNGRPGSQQLFAGCNEVVIGSAAGTAVSAIAGRVSPPVVVSIYRYNNQLQRYQAGYFAMTGAPIDFSTTRGGIESYQICVSAPATISTG